MGLRQFFVFAALALCFSLGFAQPSGAQGQFMMAALPPASPPAATRGIQPLDVNSFDPTLDREQLPVLVQFHAVWCSYCKILQPYLDALQVKKTGNMDFYAVDADVSPELMMAYKIRVLPTLIIFYKGKIIARADGAAKPEDMIKWVNEIESDIKKLPADFGQ